MPTASSEAVTVGSVAMAFKPDKEVTPKRTARNSLSMKRTDEGANGTDVPTDVLVSVSGVNFSLHKFPLTTKSGLLKSLVAESKNSDVCQLDLLDIPGGVEAFELATKFCYGVRVEITTSNVAMLRCAAEYLEMTDDYAEKNLVMLTETFLNEVGIQNLSNAIAVLHSCESLLPMAEELKIVSRCIDAAASISSTDQVTMKLLSSNFSSFGQSNGLFNLSQPKTGGPLHSWTEELSILRLDFYQRVLVAMKSRGVHPDRVWESLLHYARCSLKGVTRKQVGLDLSNQDKLTDRSMFYEHDQRILVETLVNMLPSQPNPAFCSFLFYLLRTAIVVDTTVACRLDIEHRISMQLDQATLDDLLIPSFLHNGDTLFDVDLVLRLVISFLQHQENEDFQIPQALYSSNQLSAKSQTSILKIGKLIDNYLAEIAPDLNLKLDKFVAMAEILPDYARVVDDGLYRAVDIYLKAHPSASDLDRKKLCKLIDPQKLSQEACAHAAQNERLHAQFMVQVVYFEQLRLRLALAKFLGEGNQHGKSSMAVSEQVSASASPHDSNASLLQENRELKMELARMRSTLSDLEKDPGQTNQHDVEKPIVAANNTIFQLVSKKLGRLNPFARSTSKEQKEAGTTESLRSRRRRHSVS